MRKAQIGSFVAIGLVLVGIIVGYYQYKDSSVFKDSSSSSIYENQNLLRESIRHNILVNSLESLKYLENHGAYDENVHEYKVAYLNDFVPVWQMCDKKYIPKRNDLEKELAQMIKNKLLFEKNIFNQGTYKNVTFLKDPNVDVKILPDKIKVDVVWPYKFEEKIDSNKYSIEIPTMFGDIITFYNELTNHLSQTRNFERYTMYSIYYSNNDKLPTMVFLTDCGESIDLSPYELNKNLELAIRYTLSHTAFFDGNEVFINPENEAPQYNIPEDYIQKSNQYNPYLSLADNYIPGYKKGITLDNNHKINSLIPLCISSYTQSYSFSYPLILKLRDPSTGYIFKIATIVDIDSDADNYMHPGDCSSVYWGSKSEMKLTPTNKPKTTKKSRSLKSVTVSFRYLNLTSCNYTNMADVVTVLCMNNNNDVVSQFNNFDQDSFDKCATSCKEDDKTCLTNCMTSAKKYNTIKVDLNSECTHMKIYTFRNNQYSNIFDEKVSLKDVNRINITIPMYWIPDTYQNNSCINIPVLESR